jgi:hypothetical protein
MPFYIRVPSLITPVHCITQTEDPAIEILRHHHLSNEDSWQTLIKRYRLFVTWYGSIGEHKSTKSLSGKRLN